MTKEHIEDIKEIIKLSKEEQKHLKKAGVVYSMFSVAGVVSTFVFAVLEMPMEAVVCGMTAVSCAAGTLFYKLEENGVKNEIIKYEEKLKRIEK